MIIFTRSRLGAYDPATDTYGPPTITTITGEGALLSGDPEQFAAQELILETTAVIKFIPDDYPLRWGTEDFVIPGDTLAINDNTYTAVKTLKFKAPDGYIIAAWIAVTR